MILLIVLFMASFGIGVIIMISQKKSTKEINVFIVLALLGLAFWISILLHREMSPNRWIVWIIKWLHL